MNASETTIVSFQAPLELRDELAALASRHDRSLSGEIREAIRAHLADVPATRAQPRIERGVPEDGQSMRQRAGQEQPDG
jgi:predicted DNA-binding protein